MAQEAKQMFGKYQILERIATGGMAEILKARTESIGGFQKTFAIKRVLAHLSANKEYVAMLVDEAKIAGLLSHANIVQILDLGQIDNVWFIAMEYVAGSDLGRILARAKEKGLLFPVPHAVFIAMELLKGLEYAHKRQVMKDGRPVPLNIVHRDISPPNILLSFQGEVKLTDFGIASANHKTLETEAGIVKGRYDYMSPEQAQGRADLDCRSDLFSLGVVLYEMLAGEHPFRMETEMGTLDRIRLGQFVPLMESNPAIPAELAAIVERTLMVERDERYASAKVLREALDGFFHDAEFLFTHSTLASYMKSLLPEGSGGTVKPAPRRSPSQEPEDVELELPPGDKKNNSLEDPPKPKADLLAASFPDPSEWDDDLDTVVGAPPDLGTPKPVRRVSDDLDLDLDEQETLVRPSVLPKLPPDPSELPLERAPQLKARPLPPDSETPRPATPRKSPPKPRATPRPTPKVEPPAAAGPQEQTKTSAGLWPLMSMVTFLMGLFFGSLMGVFVVIVLGWV